VLTRTSLTFAHNIPKPLNQPSPGTTSAFR